MRARPSSLRLARFARACGGNVAVVIAIAAPTMMALTLGATDVASILNDRQRIRSIAEGAALAGARNLSVAMSEQEAVAHARAMAESMIEEWRSAPELQVGVGVIDVADGAKGVRVTLDAHRASFFNDLLPPGGWRYDVAATASSVGVRPLCVLAFAEKGSKELLLRDSAHIVAPECLVHSNGNVVVSGGRIEAARTQAVLNASGDIAPDPVTDAPSIRDPFASLDLNASQVKCVGKLKNAALLVALTGTHRLPPGDHCGVITIGGDANVILEPGEHRFGLGSLIVRDNGRLTGDDVVLIVDKLWRTSFLGESVISLTGRRDGLLAGFVMIADRDNTQPFDIDTSHVERLDGVIYVPSSELRISAKGDVARQSDWTVIVAESLRLTGNPNLYINAEYDRSELGPPPGVGPRRDAVRLIE
jgi:hypothetical protein